MNIPKKWIIIGVVVIALFLFGKYNESQKENTNKTIEQVEDVEIDNSIKGANPVDVYLNLENKGFKIDKQLSSTDGCFWYCKKSESGIDYNVTVFSSKTETIEEVRINAGLTGLEDKKIIAAKPFLKYVSSLPYEGSDANKVAEWIENNFNKNKDSIIIGDAKYQIFAPTKFVRQINITKSK